MNNHDEGHPGSVLLCDELFLQLRTKITDLQRASSLRWCGFFQQGKKRFAFVSHRRRNERLEIWFLGEAESLDAYPSLNIRQRTPTSGGFGKDFKSRFYLDDTSQLEEAVDLLFNVSYHASG